ncbi:MAG: GNAT family N-acetyltransferase [Woeseiaceae bacterium]|nr:GNAT family N-acetyltransferase [Woeseiaceae bacterium]
MLETSHLSLRKMTLEDVGLMLAVWNDPAFIRYVGDRGIRTIDDAREAMKSGALQLYERYGYGPYRVALKDTDTPIGICGLFRREGLDVPDLGYSTLPEFCGRGYAFEAAVAVMDYACSELSIDRLIAIISPENSASIGLIGKLGFEFERMHTMPGDEDAVRIYSKLLN